MWPWARKVLALISGDTAVDPMERHRAAGGLVSAPVAAPAVAPLSAAPPIKEHFVDASYHDCVLGRISAALSKHDAAAVAEQVGELLGDADDPEDCVDTLDTIVTNVMAWEDPDATLALCRAISEYADEGDTLDILTDKYMKEKMEQVESQDPAHAIVLYCDLIETQEYCEENVAWFIERLEGLGQNPLPAHIPDFLEKLYDVPDQLSDDESQLQVVHNLIIRLGRMMEPHDRFHTLDALSYVYGEIDDADPRAAELAPELLDLCRDLMFRYPETAQEALTHLRDKADEPISEQADQLIEQLEMRSVSETYDDAPPMTAAAFQLRHGRGAQGPL